MSQDIKSEMRKRLSAIVRAAQMIQAATFSQAFDSSRYKTELDAIREATALVKLDFDRLGKEGK